MSLTTAICTFRLPDRPSRFIVDRNIGFLDSCSVSPVQMEAEPFVVTRDEPLPYIRYRDRHGLGRRIGGFADSLNERMWLIQLGMGIGFLPKPIVDSSNFASVLWPLLADEEAPGQRLSYGECARGP